MKKNLLLCFVFLLSSSILLACNSSDESEIIGSWELEPICGVSGVMYIDGVIYRFREDGIVTITIRNVTRSPGQIEWSTEDGTLSLRRGRGLSNERATVWRYSIDGDVLTLRSDIVNRQMVFHRVPTKNYELIIFFIAGLITFFAIGIWFIIFIIRRKTFSKRSKTIETEDLQ